MAREGNPGMDEFDALTAELTAESRLEQVQQAREMLAAADGQRTYVEMLRRIPPSEVVALTMTDGVTVRGRIVQIGTDGLRLAEVGDGAVTARPRRLHEIRLAAVIRVSRGWTR